jgi:hypothetical protein
MSTNANAGESMEFVVVDERSCAQSESLTAFGKGSIQVSSQGGLF